jgi:hypothetical protein
MNARAVALQSTIAALLLSCVLLSPASAIDSEKQPIYSNIENNSLCGTDPMGPFPPSPCTVPAGNRLIIEHVSGYVFVPPPVAPATPPTTVAVQIVITDPGLGLNEAAFHSFVATLTSERISNTYSFSTPFRMMLNAGAKFFFAPTDNVAVSGYLVKQ